MNKNSILYKRKLKELEKLLSLQEAIKALLPIQHLYDWDNKLDWCIGKDAFDYVNQHPKLQFIQVFCHPKLIREQPQLIAYYRNVAVLSQKAVISLIGIQVKRFESDLDNGGKTTGVIEVKGGTDTAGALERYGAAIKSFEEARRRNSKVKTILIASCITTEVNNRIHNDKFVSCYFNLTEILSENSEQYEQFVEEVFSIL
ncbi:MAG: XcyI family restriction endonuclease [Methylacidiphilales bacterium]|nr:XcyI family restriction endonuclease [Candidatus Methylacidiphilales bacterium]NJR16973.1 XcyI family restriction endonuclease [Calothrix sp. CSU_2_0]